MFQETDRRLRKLDALFNSQWGKLIESLAEGNQVSRILNWHGFFSPLYYRVRVLARTFD